MFLHVFWCHAKWKAVYTEEFLPVGEGRMGQTVNLFDLFVRHGEASDGATISVDHQRASGPAMSPVIFVGIAQIEGKMKATVWVHARWGDVVKTLGCLAIAFTQFRSRLT